MGADHLGQLGGHHADGVEDHAAQTLGVAALFGRDPDAGHPVGGVDGLGPPQVLELLFGADGQELVDLDLALSDLDLLDLDHVGVGLELQVVPEAHAGDHDAQFQCDVAPDRGDPVQQLGALVRVHQRQQTPSHLQGDGVDLHQLDHALGLLALGLLLLVLGLGGDLGDLDVLLVEDGPQGVQASGNAQEGHVHREGHAGQDSQDTQHAHEGGTQFQGARLGGDLLDDVAAQVGLRGRTGDDHAHRRRHQEGGEGGDQAVPDGQDGIGVQRVRSRHPVHQDTDQDAADHVYDHDHDGGHRVALDELAGAVHSSVEVGFPLDVLALLLGGFGVEKPRVQVGIDGHLLTGHGVQGEAGCHLGDTLGTVRDHHDLDDDQDDEHDEADDQVAAHGHLAEHRDQVAGPDGDLAGRVHLVPVQQDHSRGRDVQRQSEEGGHQQGRREDGELQGFFDVDGDQDRDDRRGQVEGQEDVQERGRQGDDQHRDDADHHHGDADIRVFQEAEKRVFSARCRLGAQGLLLEG